MADEPWIYRWLHYTLNLHCAGEKDTSTSLNSQSCSDEKRGEYGGCWHWIYMGRLMLTRRWKHHPAAP